MSIPLTKKPETCKLNFKQYLNQVLCLGEKNKELKKNKGLDRDLLNERIVNGIIAEKEAVMIEFAMIEFEMTEFEMTEFEKIELEMIELEVIELEKIDEIGIMAVSLASEIVTEIEKNGTENAAVTGTEIINQGIVHDLDRENMIFRDKIKTMEKE